MFLVFCIYNAFNVFKIRKKKLGIPVGQRRMYFDQASVTYTDVDEMHVVLG
jgi:hypothetical protein